MAAQAAENTSPTRADSTPCTNYCPSLPRTARPSTHPPPARHHSPRPCTTPGAPPAPKYRTTCPTMSARPYHSSHQPDRARVDRTHEPRMIRRLRSIPTAPSRNFPHYYAPVRQHNPPRYSHPRHRRRLLPLATPAGLAISGYAFPRSTRKPQIRFTSPLRRTPPGQSAGTRQTPPGPKQKPGFDAPLSSNDASSDPWPRQELRTVSLIPT